MFFTWQNKSLNFFFRLHPVKGPTSLNCTGVPICFVYSNFFLINSFVTGLPFIFSQDYKRLVNLIWIVVFTSAKRLKRARRTKQGRVCVIVIVFIFFSEQLCKNNNNLMKGFLKCLRLFPFFELLNTWKYFNTESSL